MPDEITVGELVKRLRSTWLMIEARSADDPRRLSVTVWKEDGSVDAEFKVRGIRAVSDEHVIIDVHKPLPTTEERLEQLETVIVGLSHSVADLLVHSPNFKTWPTQQAQLEDLDNQIADLTAKRAKTWIEIEQRKMKGDTADAG